jgi:glycerol uptake facilitator protein
LIAFFTFGSKGVQGAVGYGAGFNIYIVAMVIWAIGLSFGGPTGYAINPARDLGPRIAHAILPIAGKGGSNWGYAWVPVVGPMLGASLAFVICKAAGLV